MRVRIAQQTTDRSQDSAFSNSEACSFTETSASMIGKIHASRVLALWSAHEAKAGFGPLFMRFPDHLNSLLAIHGRDDKSILERA